MCTLFCFTPVTKSKPSYKYWLLSFLVQCGIKLLRHKTPLIPVCLHLSETLKLCGSAVVYRWFPLLQMIKTNRSTREAPSVSVFLCIAPSVACQSNSATQNRDNTAPEFVLNGIWSETNRVVTITALPQSCDVYCRVELIAVITSNFMLKAQSHV